MELDVLGTMALSLGDEEWKASGINVRLISRMQLCLDASVCLLLVLSTREIDRRVLSEETIDNCIQLFNHVIKRLIVPCIDSTAAAAAVPVGEKSDTPHEQETHSGSPQSKARPKNRRSAASFNIRTNREIRSAIAPLVNVACEFIEQLSTLVLTVKLADRWILHFSSSMVELFLLEHSMHATSLQQSAMAVLRGIFLQYEPHRLLILDEIVGVMKKLPTSKRHLRTVKLLDSSNHVQMISTLVVAMVQSSASIRDIEKENAVKHDASDPTLMLAEVSDGVADSEIKEFEKRVEDTRHNAGMLVRALVKECLKKHEEHDYRVVLENFAEDLLVMFVRPEWAGAEVILEVLSSSLASILHANVAKDSRKLESHHTLTALNLIGKICTSIKTYQNKATRDILEDDVDARSVLDDHARFLGENAVVAKREDEKTQHKLIDSSVILKHILVVFTRRSNRMNIAQDDSRRLLLARFITESCRAPEVNPDVNFEVPLWKSFWKNSPQSVDSTSKLLAPSGSFVQRLSLHLAVTREFCCLFDKLLAHVMSLLSKGIPTFRARVLKILAAVIDVDPMLMGEGGVRAAVNRCFMDEGTSVRQAAVDLVGRHVALQPVLVSLNPLLFVHHESDVY